MIVINQKENQFIQSIIVLFAALIIWFPSAGLADNLTFKLPNNKIFLYRHWNTRENKITGYSLVAYSKVQVNNKPYIVEFTKNTKPDGEVFLEKKTFFHASSGKLSHYEEIDHRSNLRVFNQYDGNTIHTTIKKGKIKKELTIDYEKDLIPFETITLSLQKKIPQLLLNNSFEFTLYLPLIAFELEKSGLPLSLSKIKLKVTIEKELDFPTPQGIKPAIQLLARPSSLFIRSLLPQDKTEFRFIYMKEAPYLLLQFEENETQTILNKISDATP